MGVSRIARTGRVARAGGGSLFDPLAHTILTITNNGGIPSVLTSHPHELPLGGANVIISGNTNPTYNGAFFAAWTSASTFDIDTAYDVDGTGGTWALA